MLEIDKALSITGPSAARSSSAARDAGQMACSRVFRIGEAGTDDAREHDPPAMASSGIVNRGTAHAHATVVAESCGAGISSTASRHSLLSNSFVIDNSGVGPTRVDHRGAATLAQRYTDRGQRARRHQRLRYAAVTLANSTVARNSAGNGGGIFVRGRQGPRSLAAPSPTTPPPVRAGASSIRWTMPSVDRGALVALTNSTVSGNSAASGGGISNAPERSSVVSSSSRTAR